MRRPGEGDLEWRARTLAYACHTEQRYAGRPFTDHLEHVRQVGKRFGIEDENIVSAIWLHDVLEDCPDISEQWARECFPSVRCFQLVVRVTDEPGKNRRERKAKTLCKTAGDPDAITVKLCDRIANVEQCLADGSSLFGMYRKEHDPMMRAFFGGPYWDVEPKSELHERLARYLHRLLVR